MDTKFDNAFQVYSGQAMACMCGCKGKHSYASKHLEYATENTGYDVSDSVNDRSVKIIYNKVMRNPDREVDTLANCVYVNTDTRTLAVYFKRADALA